MIIQGDCLEKMKTLEDNSIDAIVTDPPYGLSFMGKKWDYDVPSKEIWIEALRVLKPGGHLLAFGGTRTYHRLVVNIEDAGFEIRDQIQWLYGSGFPKSTDVSKRIDKEAGATREVIGIKTEHNIKSGNGNATRLHNSSGNRETIEIPITKPSTDSAKTWQGWGTALKPANEPICVARKPLEKGLTVAQNVLKWGTGAINIDECRIATNDNLGREVYQTQSWKNTSTAGVGSVSDDWKKGRWPANIILDEEAAESLNTQAENVSRFFYCAKASKSERNKGLEGMPTKPMNTYNFSEDGSFTKNSTSHSGEQVREARQNFHPTVKPIKLMEYLIKLVTPKSGTVMDPFMGSGSSGVAAKNLGFKFIGIEMNPEYADIAEKRIG